MTPGLSVFFPAYNDGGTIASMVIMALRVCRSLTHDYEVIVVNDGSSDHTAEILAELERNYDRVRIVTHEKNRGYGGALRTGFRSATKDLVFYTDGDAQYDVRELPVLWKKMVPGVDIVNGYKISRSDPLHRIIIGNLYNKMVKLMFGLRIRDVDCDFRLIRRHVLDNIELNSNSGTICLEFVKKGQDQGFVFAEAPVHHFHRAYGKSQFFNWRRLIKTAVNLSQLWLELRAEKRAETPGRRMLPENGRTTDGNLDHEASASEPAEVMAPTGRRR